MGVHKTETQREKIGFSIGWEQKWIEWTYDIYLFIIVMASVSLVLLIQELFIPFLTSSFLKDGVLVDYIKSYLNLGKTFYSSVYDLELYADKYFKKFYIEFIKSAVFFIGEFAVLTILFYKAHRPWFTKLNKSLTKEIHVDRILKGTDIRQDEEYLKIREELGMNDKSKDYLSLGKIYKREVIQ